MEPRKTELKITYEGVDISRDISPFLVSFNFTDSGDERADDLQITLADREGRWRDPWMPKRGERIQAEIISRNRDKSWTAHSLKCGMFSVDAASFSGPPDVVTIQAASLPANTNLKNEEVTKSWEKVTLSQIARSIANKAKLKLLFETEDVKYDRIDQTQQSDIAFLTTTAYREGVSTKITNDTIVLFDDRKFESIEPVRVIEREPEDGTNDVIDYSFEYYTTDAAYAACQVSYYETNKKKKRTITGTYRIPGATGPTLKINERVESQAEAIRKARKALRQKNKEAQRATFTLLGDYRLLQGVTVEVAGFGYFDAKYFVETATHSVGSNGYRTKIELRKVLGY